MTQHWADIDNTSLLLVWGANPVENHPACAAHMNAARYGTKKAKMIVIDPRLTRTGRQINPANGDFYVRIRPGTDIAFGNGVLNWIFNNASTYDSAAWTNLLAWHNGTQANTLTLGRTFVDDAGTTLDANTTGATANGVITLNAANLATAKYDGVATTVLSGGYPKYCDSRFKVTTDGTDYQRATLTVGPNADYTTDKTYRFSHFPLIAADVSDPDCVFQKLKTHVSPYTASVVADICGCSASDIAAVGQALIDHSRFKSNDFTSTGLGANGSTPKNAGYRATTILYAMGQTQHTCGSQNIKNFAILQTLLGNMGRAGGGINALRGIHNVQGSTDFGLLYDNIPGYSGNPGATDTYEGYLNGLFGNRTVNDATFGSTGAKDVTNPALLGLQQRGFANMTTEWFGNGTSSGADIKALYDCWPKGNGVQHITAFRNMNLAPGDANLIKASVVWGQNPCVSEPNQGKVRAGLKNLDTLVCVDMFLNETATCDRKDGAATYFIPACSHVEEAGSVTSSGRWLQWRYRATAPKGNSKSDLELMLRLAYALDNVPTGSAFSHIIAKWGALSTKIVPSVTDHAYAELYGKYGWTPGTGSFEALSATTEVWGPGPASATNPSNKAVLGSEVVAENLYKELARPLNYKADGTQTNITGGTMWIYSGSGTGGGNADATGQAGYSVATIPSTGLNVMPAVRGAWTGQTIGWQVHNRAKSRNNWITGDTSATADSNANNFPRWGWAWLLNRRVFYNNGEIGSDQSDNFVNPGLVCNMFTMQPADAHSTLGDWSLVYRKWKLFADKPSTVAAGTTSSPQYVDYGVPGTPNVRSLAGRFPGHTEPYESPRADLVTTWGQNQSGTSRLVPGDTAIGTVANFPLVLTTIRCVEHFQGGPITRNNSWNVEAEPVPWIEINSEDALTYGISDGDWVAVATARSNGRSDQVNLAPNAATGWNRGFKARVQAGLQSNQRVAPGVVAIPWHWGEKGLSTGSRANDLCIDAYDANTQIPEYKACLCSISKM